MPKDSIINKIVKEAVAEVRPRPTPVTEAPALEPQNEAYVVQSRKFVNKTESISEKTKVAHQGLLDGYVKALNEISAKLDSVSKDEINPNNTAFRSLKIDEAYNINAAFLHGLYFENIGDMSSQVTTDSLTYMRIERDWGTFDNWQKEFIACALAARNGWAVTCYNTFLNRYINVVVDLHSGNVPFGCIPVIVMDCWEHAYYRDYLNDRKSYVFAMMKELKWLRIEERFEKAERVSKVMR